MDLKTRALPLVFAVLVAAPAARADLAAQMDRMFDSMTNHTAPTAHLGQRRGVISGGSIVHRNKIMSENLVSIVPPSFAAGCGGIDLFAGSFSFINADQLVQMLRSVASNAAGYAFELALGSMCPECLQTIETMARKIQELNQGFSNSCQLSKGLVNDTLSAFTGKANNQESLLGMIHGAGDVFETRSNATGSSPPEQAEAAAPAEVAQEIKGNLVWRALQEQGAIGWFAGGDTALAEAIMSLTGSVIVGELEPAADGRGRSRRVSIIPGGKIRVADLLSGSGAGGLATVSIYRCAPDTSADGCLSPTTQDITLKGMSERVRDILLGPGGGGGGMIDKAFFGVDRPNATEQAFMELVPAGTLASVVGFARTDRGAAASWVDEAAPAIAIEMVYVILRDLIRSARAATALEDNAHAKQMWDQLIEADRALAQEYQVLVERHGTAADALTRYKSMMELIRKEARRVGERIKQGEERS